MKLEQLEFSKINNFRDNELASIKNIRGGRWTPTTHQGLEDTYDPDSDLDDHDFMYKMKPIAIKHVEPSN